MLRRRNISEDKHHNQRNCHRQQYYNEAEEDFTGQPHPASYRTQKIDQHDRNQWQHQKRVQRTSERLIFRSHRKESTGNPSLTADISPDGKAREWPLYDLKDKQMMIFDEHDIHVEKESERKLLDWDRTYFLTKYYTI